MRIDKAFGVALWLAMSARADDVAALKKELAELRARVAELELSSAKLDPKALNKYESVQTPAGRLLMSLGKVERVPDGYKIELQIGNPLLAMFKGYRLTVAWGSGKKKEFAIKKTLTPSRWNSVPILLPETSPELGPLEVSIEVDSISLAPGLVR